MGNVPSSEVLDAEKARESEISAILASADHKIVEQKINNEIIRGIPEGLANHSETLESLNMNSNKIDDCRGVALLPNLRRLSLAHNWIVVLPPELFAPTNLEFLDLSHNEITIISPAIGNLKMLTTLIASYNDLTDIPAEIASCLALKTLILDHNRVRNKTIQHI